MRGLIINRNKYIVERSRYTTLIKRFAAFGVSLFIIGLILIFNARNIRGVTDNEVQINTNSLSYENISEQDELETEEDDVDSSLKDDEVEIIRKNITEEYLVTKVVDGDTVYVSGIDTRIRLIGVNTPETVSPSKPVQCFGPEASDYLKNLLLGKKVGLESDEASGDTDIYGRPLRYVYYNGENINQKLILEGYGKEADYGSEYKYSSEFKASQQDAISNNRGLWSPVTCNGRE